MTNIHIRPLRIDDVPMLREFDEQVFPEYMHTTNEEYAKRVLVKGTLYVEYRKDNILLGAAYALPASYVQDKIEEYDPLFIADHKVLYSCSEGVLPSYQHKGIGSAIVHAMAEAAKANGYTHLCAHVHGNGWQKRRARLLRLSERRTIMNFWEDRNIPVEFQLANLLHL